MGVLMSAAFALFDVAVIRGRCLPDNVQSAAVLTRCGMIEVEPTERYRNFEIARPS